MNFICTPCNQSFPSLEALEAHEKAGHATKGESLANNQINPEFAETLKMIEEAEKKKREAIASGADPKQLAPDGTVLKMPEPPKPKPIQLTYKFIGNCDCGAEPKTLVISKQVGLTVIAYCLKDDKQLLALEVPHLPQPELPKTEKPRVETPKVEVPVANEQAKVDNKKVGQKNG